MRHAFLSARFTGSPDDPLLRADIAKKDTKSREALNDNAAATEVEPPEGRRKEGRSEHAEEHAEKTKSPSKEKESESPEKARAKEVIFFQFCRVFIRCAEFGRF